MTGQSNKKRCLAYLKAMRSPIEEQMAMAAMPPMAMQTLSMMPRQMLLPPGRSEAPRTGE